MDDLSKRLRHCVINASICTEAADALDAQAAEIARLLDAVGILSEQMKANLTRAETAEARFAAMERVARRAYCDLGVVGSFVKEIDALDTRAGFYIKEHIEPVRNELLALRFAALDGKEDGDG